MGATFSRVKTWSAGETLTAADLNAEFDNILNNLSPSGIDDASANATAMQAATDPYPGAAVSLPTDLAGELTRLRYLIKQLSGESQWYIDPDSDIATLYANLVEGDGTAGRVLRRGKLTISDGTNASSLSCTLASEWNGDSDGATDNCAKGATTGNFTLNAGGTELTIEAAALSGNAIMAFATIARDQSTANVTVLSTVSSNDIVLKFYAGLNGNAQDLTSLVDSGDIDVDILYMTAA